MDVLSCRAMQEKVDELRREITNHQMTNAKLTTQLDYSLESSKVIEKNSQGYKREITTLRAKAEQYSNLVAKVGRLSVVRLLAVKCLQLSTVTERDAGNQPAAGAEPSAGPEREE